MQRTIAGHTVSATPDDTLWPTEAKEAAANITTITGKVRGELRGYSIATTKTGLRRLYSALGGVRSHYDPNADELRALYDGTVTAYDLMRKGGNEPATSTEAASAAMHEPMANEPRAVDPATGFANRAPTVEEASEAFGGASKSGNGKEAASEFAALLAKMMSSAIDAEQVRTIAAEAVDSKVAPLMATLGEQMPALIEEAVNKASRRVEIIIPERETVKIEQAHQKLETVLKAVMAGVHPFLVGPAGSGKTTLAEQIAKALGRKFYMAARVSSEFKLTGFIDASGNAVRTAFREAFEHGGVFLFDEVDASDADALTAFNAPLANGWADFPDGMVPKHPDFIAIAAGNTYGRGADRQYVGRQQLDAATLDRFAVIDIDYDEGLELAIAGNDDWTRHVQRVRAAVERERIRAIVSPRCSINGARMLAAGLDRETVEEAVIWKGMQESERNRVMAAMR